MCIMLCAMDYRTSFFLSIIFVYISFVLSVDISCKTPKNAPGECKEITSCTKLLKILQSRPITSEGADILKSSQCGFEHDVPKVCCPSDDNKVMVEGTVQKSSEEESESGPIISNLLPPLDVCGTYTEEKVIGGEKAGILEFPWMVLIGYQKEDSGDGKIEYNCGGSLINSRYVVTAAHCVNGRKVLEESWNVVSVRLGEYDKTSNPDCDKFEGFCADLSYDVPIEEKIIHEKYSSRDRNYYNDIALLRLAEEVRFTDFVRPICLPTSEQMLQVSYSEKYLTVAGWGHTENGTDSDVKLKLQIPVRTEKYCISQYAKARVQLRSGQLCAGGQIKKDSCQGDSGGPLMTIEHHGTINWYLVGVVSIGPDSCGTSLWPGVYTKVASYVRWIVRNIKP